MEENENIEAQEVNESELDSFYGGWDEDEPAASTEPEEVQEEPAEENTEAEEPETGSVPESESGPEPDIQDEAGNQRFKVKYLGEEKELDLAEMTELAQKGMDYDHVRQERDELKSNKAETPGNYAELQAKAGYLQEIADLAGSSIEELVLRTRARKLMMEDENLDESAAILKAKIGFDKNPEHAEKKDAQPESDDTQERLRQFLETYPDVKAEEIPQEVWKDSFAHGGDLTSAYARFENKRLKAELEQLKQSQQNKSRSTGSRRTAGAASQRSSFDEGWDSDV